MSGHVRVSGEWKELSNLYARVSGEWKELTEGWARVSGEWQKIWEKILYLYNLGAYEDNWTEGYASSIGNGAAVMEKADTYLHMNVQTGEATLENDGTVFIDNTSTTSWECPEGVTVIDVECWGGGGSGSNYGLGGGGGGGGGAYAKKTGISVSPGTTYTIKIGSGGYTADGGATFFKNEEGTEIVKAVGGSRAIGDSKGNGGAASSCIGDTKFSGGNGANGSGNNGGGGGGGAGSTGAGNNASGTTGGAAKSEYGGKGGNGGTSGKDGQLGEAYGGGGGGAGYEADYAPGYKGCMRITKYKPVSPYRERTWVTTDAVDLTNSSAVKALVTKAGDTTGVTGDLIASTNKTGARTVYNARQSFTSNGETTIELDVSGLSGSHYIRIHGSADGENKEIDLEIAKVMVS